MVKATELLSSESNADAVTALANTAFDFAKKMIEGEFLSVAIDRALNDAPKQCPHNAQYVENYVKPLYTAYEVTSQESSVSFIVGVLILCISLIFAVLAICLATKMIVRRRHQKWLEKLSREQVLLVYRQQREKQEKESEINVSTTSMFKSSSIPMWIRWFMPIVILGNIGFFLSGHFSLGASVTIIASLGGETLRSDNFFQFSMAKSTIEIWNCKWGDCLFSNFLH